MSVDVPHVVDPGVSLTHVCRTHVDIGYKHEPSTECDRTQFGIYKT